MKRIRRSFQDPRPKSICIKNLIFFLRKNKNLGNLFCLGRLSWVWVQPKASTVIKSNCFAYQFKFLEKYLDFFIIKRHKTCFVSIFIK